MTFDGTDLWVTSTLENQVARIDRATGASVTFGLPAGSEGLAESEDVRWSITTDGANVWTANYQRDSVSRLVPAS